MEAALEIEARFGHAVSRPEALRSVGDCLRLAAGELAEADSAQGEGEIAAIAVPETWTKPPTDADAPFTIPQGARNMLESFFMLCREAPRRPLTAERAASDDGPRARVRTRRDILTAVLALAEALGKLPGERLGIMLPAVPAALVAWLATLRAGKTPVLLNWTVGARNLADNLVLSGCQTVVGSAVLFERLRQTRSLPDDDSGTGRGVRWLPLEEVAAGLSWPVKARAFLRAALHCSSFPYSLRARKVSDTAAVLFTSGSETRPKGVPLSHANIMSNAADVLSVLGLARRDRVLAMLPPFHSFGLLVGLALPATVGMPAAYHANPTESAQCDAAIQDFQVSLLGAAPSFLDGMLNKARGGNTLDSLRYAFVGAESCPDRVRELFERLCPQAALCEGYGITECSPVVAVNRPGDETSGGVGKLLLSMEAALVRESDEAEQGGAAMPTERVTEGETGMLLLRGPNVFSGYLPRTDGEAVPDPFVEFEGKRWYRSGDLLAADAAGNLHFRGRRKRFVKIGGEMISLPLMEEVLCRAFVDRVGQARSDGGTADAGKPFLAVTATREGDGERVEIVVHSVVPVTLDEVNQALRQGGLSPLYAARRLRLVEEIPLLGSGKTDYRALE
jgi:acyl-CoA synthetase (AMP-forming)/AMP-acid ligase II